MCSKVIASDLHALRDIRNQFAHTVATSDDTELTFKSQHIKDKCLALKCIKHEAIAEPRHAFVRACAVLNSDFSLHRFFGQKVSSDGYIHAKVETGI